MLAAELGSRLSLVVSDLLIRVACLRRHALFRLALYLTQYAPVPAAHPPSPLASFTGIRYKHTDMAGIGLNQDQSEGVLPGGAKGTRTLTLLAKCRYQLGHAA